MLWSISFKNIISSDFYSLALLWCVIHFSRHPKHPAITGICYLRRERSKNGFFSAPQGEKWISRDWKSRGCCSFRLPLIPYSSHPLSSVWLEYSTPALVLHCSSTTHLIVRQRRACFPKKLTQEWEWPRSSLQSHQFQRTVNNAQRTEKGGEGDRDKHIACSLSGSISPWMVF